MWITSNLQHRYTEDIIKAQVIRIEINWKDKHLQKSIGEEVEIKLFKPIDKCKEFSGILESFNADNITITEDGSPRTFARADIALIRLALDF